MANSKIDLVYPHQNELDKTHPNAVVHPVTVLDQIHIDKRNR